jgi:AcrR family transcriptional regulator
LGLRESKKRQTREHIAEEAMRLFVTRGFDDVTVAEIADAAGVSEKTVFNYFPTKEDLFFDDVPARLEAMVAGIRGRKAGTSVFAALREQQLRNVKRITSPEFAHFARVIDESPALQAKELDVMRYLADGLAAALRDELGASELESSIAANAIVSMQWQVFRNARANALAGRHGPPAERRLRTDVNRAHDLLEHGLSALEST